MTEVFVVVDGERMYTHQLLEASYPALSDVLAWQTRLGGTIPSSLWTDVVENVHRHEAVNCSRTVVFGGRK
jgi:hypothetical protein